jgi:hypothetical protein
MSKPTRLVLPPRNRRFGDSRIQIAKWTLKQAGRYIEAGDAVRAAQLLQEAERIAIELAKEQTKLTRRKPD